MTSVCLIALASGCAQTTTGDYCDLADPSEFSSSQTIDWLMANDRRLLEQIVIQNETYKRLCM